MLVHFSIDLVKVKKFDLGQSQSELSLVTERAIYK